MKRTKLKPLTKLTAAILLLLTIEACSINQPRDEPVEDSDKNYRHTHYTKEFKFVRDYREGTECMRQYPMNNTDSLVFIRYKHHDKVIYEGRPPWHGEAVEFFPDNIDTSLIQFVDYEWLGGGYYSEMLDDTLPAALLYSPTYPLSGCQLDYCNVKSDWKKGNLDFTDNLLPFGFEVIYDNADMKVAYGRLGIQIELAKGPKCDSLTTISGLIDIRSGKIYNKESSECDQMD